MSTLKVNSIQHSNGTDALTIDSTGHATFNKTFVPANPLTNRNLIINGDMRIDQRNAGASVTVTSGGTGNYTLDRWYAMENTDGSSTVQQVTDAPDSYSHSLKYTITSADTSLSATQFGLVRHNFEANIITQLAYGTSSAKTITISFWVKSSVTGTYSVSINNSSYTSGYVTEYTISSANTWEQKSITIAGDTSGTWNLYGNGNGLALHFGLGTGSNFIRTPNSWFSGYAYGTASTTNLFSTNGATWQITGVQLEVGDAATPFEHRPYDMELARCMRYYEKSFNIGTAPSNGFSENGSSSGLGVLVSFSGVNTRSDPFYFKVRKRTLPTITAYNPDLIGTTGVYAGYNGSWSALTSWALYSHENYWVISASLSGASTGQSYITAGGWAADAEL